MERTWLAKKLEGSGNESVRGGRVSIVMALDKLYSGKAFN